MQFKDYWDETHKTYSMSKTTYDNWLDDYKEVLDNCKTEVLDLGCGVGNDTLYLTEKGFRVVACDYSDVAIEKINKEFVNVETKIVDISKPLPFENNSFDLIIADLSLHYFDQITTKDIMREIKRILTPNGYLIARVNSVDDINHGAGQGEKLEENFFFVEGYNKRFFTTQDAIKFFSIIGETKVKEADMLRYTKPKKVLEILVQKSSK